MTRTFELSSDGRQFFETVHVDRGKSKGMLVIRFVYDASSPAMQTGPDNDPNRPVLKRKADTGNSRPGAPKFGCRSRLPIRSQPAQKRPADPGCTTAPSSTPDPNQPVMRRRTDGGNSSSQ